MESPGGVAEDAARRASSRRWARGCRSRPAARRGRQLHASAAATLQDFRETGPAGLRASATRTFEAQLRDLLRRCTARPHHVGRALSAAGDASRSSAPAVLRRAAGAAAPRGRDASTSSWRPSCATGSGCWNDVDLSACCPTAAWAGSTPAGPQPTSCSRPGSGWRGTSRATRFHGRSARRRAARSARRRCARRRRRCRRCAERDHVPARRAGPRPTGSCCTSGTW